VHWRLIGFVKGEAFYQGRPTSYWSTEAFSLQWLDAEAGGGGETCWVDYHWMRPVSSVEQVLATLNLTTIKHKSDDFVLLNGDSTAIPVLIALLRDPEPQVRQIAAQGLGKVGAGASAAIPAISIACHDENDMVQQQARQALRAIDPEAARKVGRE
jgi:hypothetical protein